MNWGHIFQKYPRFHFVSDFKHRCRISNIRQKIKMQISIFTEIVMVTSLDEEIPFKLVFPVINCIQLVVVK